MNIKKLSALAFFIALSVVGGMIKIPAVVTSVALDSFPSLLAGALLGGGAGAVTGAFGHFISAYIGGMPMGPLHFLVAAEMAVLAWIFAILYRRGKKLLAGLLFLLGNAFVIGIPFIFIFSFAFYAALISSLFIATLVNVAVGLLLIPRLSAFFKGAAQEREARG